MELIHNFPKLCRNSATLTNWLAIPTIIFFLGHASTIASETPTIKMPINRQISYQSNSITISRTVLQQPLNLMIETTNKTNISGVVTLEGKEITTLEDQLILDLSTLLKLGKNEISIKGNYEPKINSVTVKLSGHNTQSSLTTGGSGVLEQRLTINVL